MTCLQWVPVTHLPTWVLTIVVHWMSQWTMCRLCPTRNLTSRWNQKPTLSRNNLLVVYNDCSIVVVVVVLASGWLTCCLDSVILTSFDGGMQSCMSSEYSWRLNSVILHTPQLFTCVLELGNQQSSLTSCLFPVPTATSPCFSNHEPNGHQTWNWSMDDSSWAEGPSKQGIFKIASILLARKANKNGANDNEIRIVFLFVLYEEGGKKQIGVNRRVIMFVVDPYSEDKGRA